MAAVSGSRQIRMSDCARKASRASVPGEVLHALDRLGSPTPAGHLEPEPAQLAGGVRPQVPQAHDPDPHVPGVPGRTRFPHPGGLVLAVERELAGVVEDCGDHVLAHAPDHARVHDAGHRDARRQAGVAQHVVDPEAERRDASQIGQLCQFPHGVLPAQRQQDVLGGPDFGPDPQVQAWVLRPQVLEPGIGFELGGDEKHAHAGSSPNRGLRNQCGSGRGRLPVRVAES